MKTLKVHHDKICILKEIKLLCELWASKLTVFVFYWGFQLIYFNVELNQGNKFCMPRNHYKTMIMYYESTSLPNIQFWWKVLQL